jgi:purine-binding chemotaxis protein CheW
MSAGIDEGVDEARSTTFVVLESGRTRYCVDVRCVLGVVPVGPVTEVPGARREIRGLINVHGRVLPLGDLVATLGGRPDHRGGGAMAVLMGARDADVADIAVLGEALDVVDVADGAVDPPPPFGLSAGATFVTGIVHLGSGHLGLVLDPERLVTVLAEGRARA